MSQSKPKIALLGTGIMGAGIGHNLLGAGYPLAVWNRTATKIDPLVKAGAQQGATPVQAVSGADVIISVVGDDRSSRDVWLGPDGVLAGAPQPNAIAIEATTLSLAWVTELHRAVSNAGLRFIDCPLTGGRGGAENGALTLLVGAENEALNEAMPVLEAFSKQLFHFGPPGSGTAYKLVVNMIVAAQSVAMAEGLLLAEKAGLDLDVVVEALSSGAVASPVVKGNGPKMVKHEHEFVNFSTKWMRKDAAYAVQMAAELGQAVPLSSVAAQVYQLAVSRGLGDQNLSAVIEGLR